jgi:hypothetical protein
MVYSLVIIRSNANAVNSSPKNINRITEFSSDSGTLNMKYTENKMFWIKKSDVNRTKVVVNLDFTLRYLPRYT